MTGIGKDMKDDSPEKPFNEEDQIDMRLIKTPEFIDSKRQISLRIINEFLKLGNSFFGLLYLLSDHASFMMKINAIQSPAKKKVTLVFHLI